MCKGGEELKARVVMKNGDEFHVPNADSLFSVCLIDIESFNTMHEHHPENLPLWNRDFSDNKKIVTLKTDINIVTFDFSEISHITWIEDDSHTTIEELIANGVHETGKAGRAIGSMWKSVIENVRR